MKDEFFPHADCCIEAKVKIIYLRDSDDIISQYIGFCRVFNEQVALYGRSLRAAKETIRICRDKNLLREYLSERAKEVEGIMLTLFDQEQVWNVERENIRSEAFNEGVNRGISQGKLSMLIELVRDGSLSLPAAAKKANLDVAMFKAKMAAAL